MKKSKRTIALITLLMMLLSLLAACGGSGSGGSGTASQPSNDNAAPAPAPAPELVAPAPEGEDVQFADLVRVILDNAGIQVVNLFSPAAVGGNTNWVFGMVFDSLLGRNENGEPIPHLATSWETPDGKTFTFKLRDDVYYHNGDKFTAKDVENNILMAREAPGSEPSQIFAPVDTIEIIDDTTIVLTLHDVNVDFLYNISLFAAGIANKRAIDEDPEKGTWIGTGPYYVTGFSSNDFVTVERNDDYWGKPAITKQVRLNYIPEPTVRAIMMQNGEADICFNLNDADVPIFQNDPEHYMVVPSELNTIQAISFNMNHPIAGDYNFRMAVASVIDREEISIVAAGEFAMPTTDGTCWGWKTEFRNNDIPIIPHDIEQAKAYLEASTYKGEVLEIATSMVTNIRASEQIQQQLSLIGINTRINEMDGAGLRAYSAYDNNSTIMTMGGNQVTANASSTRASFYPGGNSNKASYSDPRVTELYDKVALTVDRDERNAMYQEIQQIVSENPPYLSLFVRILPIIAVKGLGGLVLPGDIVSYDLRYIYLEK